jgi:hypothetical protein
MHLKICALAGAVNANASIEAIATRPLRSAANRIIGTDTLPSLARR